MKYLVTLIMLSWFSLLPCNSSAQVMKTIVLNPPDITGGMPLMQALSQRASVREFDTVALELQVLSDLLWAANGVNRPDVGKRTAPSAQNAQDIDVYVLLSSGAYLYDAVKNILLPVAEGDHRKLTAGKNDNRPQAPLVCLLVSDISRFHSGEDSLRLLWAAEDAGIVSQNIALFCASEGLLTRPRAGMDQQMLRETLKLKNTQYPMLNIPVSYKKEE